jgi:hypothetical protein
MRSSSDVRHGTPATMKAALVDPRESPPEWGRFVGEQRLHAGWSSPALAAIAEAGRCVRLGMVHDLGRVVAVFCGRQVGPLFECTLPGAASMPGFAFSRQLDPAARRAAAGAFERELSRRLGWRYLAIAYRQVGPAELGVLGGGGRLRLGTSPATLLENRWGSMDEYFAGLPRNRRKLLRRRYRALSADPELAIAIAADGVAGAEASRLAYLTLRRHKRRPAVPPAGYFDALADQDGALFLSYRERGRLLAFVLAFDDGATLHCSIWGSLDPHGDGRPHLYFDYYLRFVQHMIELRRDSIRFGKGVAEIKQRYGCALVPQHVVVARR